MSIYEQAYARAMRVWKKSRREGWLDEHLRGNTRGKKASKESFMAGYLRAVVDFEFIMRGDKYGQVQGSHEQDAPRNERSKVRARNKTNLPTNQYKEEGEV